MHLGKTKAQTNNFKKSTLGYDEHFKQWFPKNKTKKHRPLFPLSSTHRRWLGWHHLYNVQNNWTRAWKLDSEKRGLGLLNKPEKRTDQNSSWVINSLLRHCCLIKKKLTWQNRSEWNTLQATERMVWSQRHSPPWSRCFLKKDMWKLRSEGGFGDRNNWYIIKTSLLFFYSIYSHSFTFRDRLNAHMVIP